MRRAHGTRIAVALRSSRRQWVQARTASMSVPDRRSRYAQRECFGGCDARTSGTISIRDGPTGGRSTRGAVTVLKTGQGESMSPTPRRHIASLRLDCDNRRSLLVRNVALGGQRGQESPPVTTSHHSLCLGQAVSVRAVQELSKALGTVARLNVISVRGTFAPVRDFEPATDGTGIGSAGQPGRHTRSSRPAFPVRRERASPGSRSRQT